MGILDSFLTTETGDDGDFIELTDDNLKATESGTDATIYLADIDGQRDTMAIKDALYNGNIIFANTKSIEINEKMNESRVMDELRDVISEIDGDIVKDGNGNVILAPKGIGISREKLE